jgi:aspartyl-tRNA(Asn)/glutamyl-tRNA(Gln) amidotransferase subunit B
MEESAMNWQDTYEAVIGLEVHAELKTTSKMFCSCANNPFHAEKPNMYTCPVCLGMPGGLPVPNKKAIEWTLMIGLAADCKINSFSKFDRKHYFYPDLSKGYQISQYDLPFCYDGKMEVSESTIRIRRIHLEEDTGKLLHKTVGGKKVSLIDFNRSGVPLVEIVTDPDIRSGKQAKEYGKKLRQLLRYLNVADCDMEQGGMRLEANISLRKKGEKKLPNYKVEVKNINSFRFLEQAIHFELERQAKLLDEGKTPAQETRGWDSEKNVTFSQRGKEEAEDYRYFPDPDIPPIRFEKNMVDAIQKSVPELPDAIAKRWLNEYKLEKKHTALLLAVDSAEEIALLEKVFSKAQEKKHSVTSLANDLINKKITLSESTLEQFEKLHATESIDETELSGAIEKVLSVNADAAEKYHKGEQQVLGFLMGQVMRAAGKKLDPQMVREAILKALK